MFFSEPSISRRLSNEDQSSERIKFKDDPKENNNIGVSTIDEEYLIDTVKNGQSYDENNLSSNTIEGRAKIKFEDNFDEEESSPGNVVFEDDAKYDENNLNYVDDDERDLQSSGKPIKFENQDNNSGSYTRLQGPAINSATEQLVFADSNRNKEPTKQNIRRPRRKPRFQGPTTQNDNLNYPGYQRPNHPSSGNPNAGYPTYPSQGYTLPGYGYPGYPASLAGTAFSNSAYPGYAPYPGSLYPLVKTGYGIYKPSGNYPNPGLGFPNGQTNIRFPNQQFIGSQNPVSQNSQPASPVSAYPVPQYPYQQVYPVPGYPQPYPGSNNPQYPLQAQAQYRPPGNPYAYPGYPNGLNRPSRRPKSFSERAVSAVAEALTSIALYDDQQCVPKILCEVAGGSSTASSPMLLKASASLQPLLTLLQAYNGVSSSPLFIFSLAAIMGLTAKGNPTECRRAYPQCPNDPEKLINYLNNHNGGFFRFFGQPEVPQKQQNLEQFYNYLSGQYGFQQQTQQNYGLLNQFSYGLLPQNGNPYNQGYTQNSYRNSNTSESEIEERIQNKPGIDILDGDNDDDFYEDQEKGSKWSFPDQVGTKKPKYIEYTKINEPVRPPRSSKTLKFPDDKTENRLENYRPSDYPRKQKNIFFPEQNYYQTNTNYQTTTLNSDEYVFDHKHGFYVKRPKATPIREERPTTYNNENVVYVVRGNGDPNHPEIVKVRPGESIYT
ncbi:uncharacterized protein LOC126053956 [Helicoverpa armigera]|uniref:uncharacterized protein LOC126053956 n=1 Tax=Helicoverpa armigera TaxID=29058 RepID=UPI0030828B3E